jgi:hypothetical protein
VFFFRNVNKTFLKKILVFGGQQERGRTFFAAGDN